MSNVIKLPYSVTRGAHSRKPRRSKNGTPEERAAKRGPPAPAIPIDRLKTRREEKAAKAGTTAFAAIDVDHFQHHRDDAVSLAATLDVALGVLKHDRAALASYVRGLNEESGLPPAKALIEHFGGLQERLADLAEIFSVAAARLRTVSEVKELAE